MAFGGVIRELKPADHAAWLPLWQDYLAFYRESLDEETSALTFKDLSSNSQGMFAYVAEQGGQLVGLVHCVPHRATWTKTCYCYLEDLFVSPDVRGGGAGRALIEAVYARADEIGATRVYWLTDKNNTTAQVLYDKLATRMSFIQYRR
jgi:GNAT superfamily N-acetyltransferase